MDISVTSIPDDTLSTSVTRKRSRRGETIVYCSLWLIVTGLFLLDEMRTHARLGLPLFDMDMLTRAIVTLGPFILLFCFSNFVLIPSLLLRNHVGRYLAGAAAGVVIVWVWQYFNFTVLKLNESYHLPPPHPNPHVRPLFPLPVMLDFVYAVLVIGVNMAIALWFSRLDYRLERESLLKANAESELAGLKAQINPHFYMNMLNNIHAMIELEPSRAQEMVLGLSRLMRHVLYEGVSPMVSLSSEIAFVRDYLALMRMRFPESKVDIEATFPSATQIESRVVPSMLMLVFIENAFKHGISYREKSRVAVSIMIEDDKMKFTCVNTKHPAPSSPLDQDGEKGGIGLRNAVQRLALIYGSAEMLMIVDDDTLYTVSLIIPCTPSDSALS